MHYHLVGILGASMSGLAEILKSHGHKVTGSDLNLNGHSAKNITPEIDKVVISAAITPQSAGWVEVEAAKKFGIPVVQRSKMLQQLMLNKYGIAVAGAHGKSTVTAMVSYILQAAGAEPTVLVGADLINWNKNFKVGKGKYFVVEACEWARQFLILRPKAAIITNIEAEHLDTYPKGLPEIQKNFKKFVRPLPKNGILVLNGDDKNSNLLAKCSSCKVKYFTKDKIWPGLKLPILGQYNLVNAAAAGRLCHELGIPTIVIKKALNEFKGLKRRLEIKGERGGVIVIDDYAHHPTEIKAALASLKDHFADKKIFCVFQPHQYSRTKLLFDNFTASFKNADCLILTEIWQVPGRDEANEQENKLLTEKLGQAIKQAGINTQIIYNLSDILQYLKKNVKKGDIIVTMGATKIYQVGEQFLKGKNG